MSQKIRVPEVQMINSDLLTTQLKAAAPQDCFGITFDSDGLSIVTSDTITPALTLTLRNLALAHDANAKTPEQQAETTGRADIANLLSLADTALSQLATKRATFAGTQNLANAAPLLLEVTDDLVAAIKVLKYIVKRIN